MRVLEPLGYLEFVSLVQDSAAVLTDSGGMQEETTYLGIPCFTLRDNTERPITCDVGSNLLLGLAPERIREVPGLIAQARARNAAVPTGWDGMAAERLVDALLETDFGSTPELAANDSLRDRRSALQFVTPPATSNVSRPRRRGRPSAPLLLLRQAARARTGTGPTPTTGYSFRWPGWLTAGRRRRQAIVQAHARAPINIRRLYRRADPQIAKALGVFGSVGMRLAQAGDPTPTRLRPASRSRSSMPTAPPATWRGRYPFDVQTRWSFYAAGSPNVVVTSFGCQGLLDGAAGADQAHFRDRRRCGRRAGCSMICGSSAGASSPITRRPRMASSITRTCSRCAVRSA